MADRKQNNQNHEAKQQLLEKRFAIDLAGVEDEINSWLVQQKEKMASAQDEQIKALRGLIDTKANIEREMATVTAELQAACIRSTGILKVVLDGRLDDYDEALEHLNGLTDSEAHAHVEASQEL